MGATGRRQSGLAARLVRNAATISGATAIASVLALIAMTINARALSLADFGTLAFLQSSALFIAGLCSFATQQPLMKMGIAALEAGETQVFRRLVARGLIVDSLSALASVTVGMALVLTAPHWWGMSTSAASLALLIGLSLAFQGYRTAEGALRVLNRFDLLSYAVVITAAVQVVVAIILWSAGAPLVWYGAFVAAGLALSPVLQLGFAWRVLARSNLTPTLGGLAPMQRRTFDAYCWSTWTTSTLDNIRSNGDSLAVGGLLSVEAVGLYNVAKQLAGILRKATPLYASVLFPELATLAARDDQARLHQLLNKAVAASGAVTIFIVLGVWAGGDVALARLYGSSFVTGHETLILLAGAAGLQLVSATYSMATQVLDKPSALVSAYAIATLAFAVAIVPAINVGGLAGAGAAQILFFVVLTIACRLKMRSAERLRGTNAH